MEQLVRQQRTLLMDAEEDRQALVFTLRKKALTTQDEKIGEALYILASMLSNIRLETVSDPKTILKTDGERIYIGPLYKPVKTQYGNQIIPFLFLHEIYHVIFAHPTRIKAVPDKELYNIIADLYINSKLTRLIKNIPDSFITLENALITILKRVPLTKEQKSIIQELLFAVVKDKLTVEQVYKAIEKIPSAKNSLKGTFKNSSFTGKDLEDNKGQEGATPSEERPNQLLKDLGQKINHLLQQMEAYRGEYQALRNLKEILSGKSLLRKVAKNIGTLPLLLGEEEYTEFQRLQVDLERELMSLIGRYIVDVWYNYSELNEDTYWLPVENQERINDIHVLVDVSGSITRGERALFASWLSKVARKYRAKIKYYEFSVGLAKERKVSSSSKITLTQGTGTVWNKDIAELFYKFKKKHTPLVLVLTDSLIEITPVAWEAITEYKKTGGKISCWTTTNVELPVCDYIYRFPHIVKVFE